MACAASPGGYPVGVVRRWLGLASLLSVMLLGLPSAEAQRPLPRTRIDLTVHQGDIRNVLRLFADVGNVNVVVGDDVSGTVSMRLRNAPWDAALRAILEAKGLDMEWDGEILRVERQTCEQIAPLRTRIVRLSHARAEEMAPLVRARLRSERGSVEVDERTNSLIVRDVDCP